jgi:hypothetical protein
MINDERVHELLARALPDTSPLPAVDPDVQVAGGRSALLRRRMSRAALTAVALLVAGVLVLPAVWADGVPGQGGPGLGRPANSQAASGSTPPPSPAASADTVPSRPGDDATALRLSTVLRAAMTQTLPGATFAPRQNGVSLDFQYKIGGQELGYYRAGAQIADALGSGSFTIVVMTSARVEAPACLAPGTDVDEVSCHGSTGPHGERMVFSVSNDTDNGRPDLMMYRLMVLKTDGTQVQLTAENTTTITDLNATATRPTPPMTEEQLIAVALNPQLTINP